MLEICEMESDYVEKIRDIVFSNLRSYHAILKKKENKHLYEYILNNTPCLTSEKYKFRTKVAWILNGLTDFPKCRTCGKKIESNLVVTQKIPLFCSSNCANKDKDKRNRIAKTKNEKYGHPAYNNHAKSFKTKLEKYGDGNYNNCEKNLKTFNQHKLESSEFLPNIISRRKKTSIEKYGCECSLHNKEIREKVKKTFLEKYNVEHPSQNENVKKKTRQTCLEKYDVDNPWKSEKIKLKIKSVKLERHGNEKYNNTECGRKTFLKHKSENPNFLKSINEKTKKTNLERYGVQSWSQTDVGKKFLSEMMSSPETQTKINVAKKKNNSFNTSKPEEFCHKLLKEAFPNVIRQHRSEKYPFSCDFYIPEKELYIEFQGTWTHGSHPFDSSSEEDLKKLEKWKEKNSKFYNNAIDTWTRRDVAKREIAKKNSINYIEFWSISEIVDWLNSISKT